jgi:hypothetical protein
MFKIKEYYLGESEFGAGAYSFFVQKFPQLSFLQNKQKNKK